MTLEQATCKHRHKEYEAVTHDGYQDSALVCQDCRKRFARIRSLFNPYHKEYMR